MQIFYFLAALLFIVGIYAISVQRRLVDTEEKINNSLKQVWATQQSRWDDLQTLFDMVSGYHNCEEKVLSNLTETRVLTGRTVSELNKQETMIQQVASTMIALVEDSPELKSDKLYRKTMDSLLRHEEKIQHTRTSHNDWVTKFNRMVQYFPDDYFAKLFGFEDTKEYLEVPNEEVDLEK